MTENIICALAELGAALEETHSSDAANASRLSQDPTVRLAVARLCVAARRTGVGAQHLVNAVRGLAAPNDAREVIALIIGTYFFPRSHAFNVDEQLLNLNANGSAQMSLQA
jgi:hypothetical protein